MRLGRVRKLRNSTDSAFRFESRQYALAARGWRVGIWEEVAQMDKDKVAAKAAGTSEQLMRSAYSACCVPFSTESLHVARGDSSLFSHRQGLCKFGEQEVPLTGSRDAAFRHYCH